MKVVPGFIEAFVEKEGVDLCVLVREGEDGCGMNEGIVPPRLLGGVTNAFILPADDRGGDARVNEAGLVIAGRGMEDGEGGRGFTEEGEAIVATVLSGVRGRPKLKGTAAASSSPSSSSSKKVKVDFLLGEGGGEVLMGKGVASTVSSAGGVKVILMPATSASSTTVSPSVSASSSSSSSASSTTSKRSPKLPSTLANTPAGRTKQEVASFPYLNPLANTPLLFSSSYSEYRGDEAVGDGRSSRSSRQPKNLSTSETVRSTGAGCTPLGNVHVREMDARLTCKDAAAGVGAG